jgi:hypothetical protein
MTMTAAQLAHLAELAALAADYFAFSDPDAARVFGDSALRAETLSAEVQRDERRLASELECLPRAVSLGIVATPDLWADVDSVDQKVQL